MSIIIPTDLHFEKDFKWGVATAACQIEGAYKTDGKGLSIWDTFVKTKGKIKSNENHFDACDFYKLFNHDLDLLNQMHIPNFRFSLAWSRIMPYGIGLTNLKGIDYYNKLIDNMLERGIEPWVTLYHWDLPDVLESQGGWTNRSIIEWFSDYAYICGKQFGDRVKNWMVLNEPMVYTGAGYFLGVHAPGRKGLENFIPAMAHAALAQAEGARALRSIDSNFNIGTTFSCSHIVPASNKEKDVLAAGRMDALLNRIYIEPALGMGFPLDTLPFLNRVEKYLHQDDTTKMKFDFDYIGIQNYTQEVVEHTYLIPLLNANIIKADKRKVPSTLMNWEVSPESIYECCKKFSSYTNAPPIYITENGAAFNDIIFENRIEDRERTQFLHDYLLQIAKAKKEGMNIKGYFVWTFIDNFEWAEGYHPRFGIVYNDFKTQVRTIKDSGIWYTELLKANGIKNNNIIR